MRTLIIDTSTEYLYVSFVENEKEIFSFLEEGKNDHSEKLVKKIEEGLKKLSLEVKDFDNIIVGIGPGSYTGLRISLTVCKIFSWTLQIPLYTVSSLNVISSGYFNKAGKYAVTMKCKRNVLYVRNLESDGKCFTNESQEEVVSDEDFLSNLDKNNQVIGKEQYSFNGVNITKMNLTKINDVHSLTPNYMR